MSDSATPWTACNTPGFPVHHRLPELAQTHVIKLAMPSNHLIVYHPLLLPSIFPSIKVFSKESILRKRWPMYRSFSFSISPSSEYSGLISFFFFSRLISYRIDRFYLPTVQGTLKSLLQHHSPKAPVLRCSAFFMSISASIHCYQRSVTSVVSDSASHGL